MSTRARVGFLIAALLPVAALYRLIGAFGWPHGVGQGLIFGLLALALFAATALLALVALYGLDQRVMFATDSSTVLVQQSTWVERAPSRRYRFEQIVSIAVVSHDWTPARPHTASASCWTMGANWRWVSSRGLWWPRTASGVCSP
ncbi:MAG: hypothetical protein NZ524_08105 [Thiobacillaceae bacterium]|nr:hypothetical protein [Thiobacillaceae bacterium]MDW8322788.1 hypothetical protein [Burkholderiales bacterium]